MRRSRFDIPEDGTNKKSKMTIQTADEGLQWKWRHYFKGVSDDVLNKIQMDDTALFSVTRDDNAAVITDYLRTILPEYARICDATACVGGNSLSFAKQFSDVTSIEVNKERYEMLCHNAEVFGLNTRIHPTNADFLQYRESMPIFDFIFFDPPWGGENYLEYDDIDMYMSNERIGITINRLKNKTRYVGLKSPQNFKLREFEEFIEAKRIYKREFEISKKKDTYWVFTLYEFPSPEYGASLHMLSTHMPVSLIQSFKSSKETALRSPGVKECEFITQKLMQYSQGVTSLIDVSAMIGVQVIFNIERLIHIHDYYCLTDYMSIIQNNLEEYGKSLSHHPQLHYIQRDKDFLLKPLSAAAKRTFTKSSIVYIDGYEFLKDGKILISNTPLEVILQRICWDGEWHRFMQMLVIRIPVWYESRVLSALGWCAIKREAYAQQVDASAMCLKHDTSLLFVQSQIPLYSTNQLSMLWNVKPDLYIKKQILSMFQTVISDRETCYTALLHALQSSSTIQDQQIWDLAHSLYLQSFMKVEPPSLQQWPRSLAQQVDRSICRVYGNKLKYIDMLLPPDLHPKQCICIGSVDAHIAHEIAKRFGFPDPKQVILIGEQDRRAAENREDYVFYPYPQKQGENWKEYEDVLKEYVQTIIKGLSEIDLIITLCPHNTPFISSLLHSLIPRFAIDATLIMNDHSPTNDADCLFLDIAHHFHRNVTCTTRLSLLDRNSINSSNINEEDMCHYRSKEEWKSMMQLLGFQYYENKYSRDLWNSTDSLQSFWACFRYAASEDWSVC